MTPTQRLAAHPYRPLIRASLGLAGLGIALVVTWFAWAAVARHRVQRRVDEITRLGQPTTAAQMANPPVADDDNAAPLWSAATAAVSGTVDCPTNSALSYHPTPLYPPAWWTVARASEAANAAAFARADVAAAHPAARWAEGRRPTSTSSPTRGQGNW